jgi:hypothetical protein
MKRLSGVTDNRKGLSQTTHAACCHCLKKLHPLEVLEWCDEDEDGVGQTALCPHCGIDAVVAYSGNLDDDWLRTYGAKLFS